MSEELCDRCQKCMNSPEVIQDLGLDIVVKCNHCDKDNIVTTKEARKLGWFLL